MGACIHLVRHGTHEDYGRVLSGRAGNASLSDGGREQALGLARWACGMNIAAVQSSPRRRTVETAQIIAASLSLEIEGVDALDELDFGHWNGRAFAELEGDALWREWNRHRSRASPPGGEGMGQAVDRAVAHLRIVARRWPEQNLLCVTHCDIIRGVLAYYLGLSLDNLLRFDIDPGSVSTVVVEPWGGRVTRMNEVPA